MDMSDLLRNLFGGSGHRDKGSNFNMFDHDNANSDDDTFESHQRYSHRSSNSKGGSNGNKEGLKCPNGDFICNFSIKGGGGPCVKKPSDCPCPNPKYIKCHIGNDKFICLNPSQDCTKFQ